MKISDVKKKSILEIDDVIYVVDDVQKILRPRLEPIYRLTLKSIRSLKCLTKNYFPHEEVKCLKVAEEKIKLTCVHGNVVGFEKVSGGEKVFVDKKCIDDALKYIEIEGIYVGQFLNGKPINVLLPIFVDVKVCACCDEKNDDRKFAIVTNGSKFYVPEYIDEGDIIRVDTRSGEFVEKVNK